MKTYDLIVIGSGGGNKIIGSALKLGKKVALIEKGKAGGTCLNRGCIPSKMLIHPANLYKHLNSLDKINLKVHSSEIDFENLIKRINTYTDGTSQKISEGRINNPNVDYYQGKAEFVEDKIIEVNGERLTATQIVIATGSRPLIPEIPGLAHTPFMTSNEALRAKRLPKSIIVIGGGYIATELGGAYSSLGSEVTFLVRSQFLRHVDSEIQEIFVKEFSKDKKVFSNCEFLKASYQDKKFQVVIKQEGTTQMIEAEELLVCAGITPNSDQLGLNRSNIKVKQNGFIAVGKFLETNVAGVFAIGDVAGNFLFRHSVNFEAEYWIKANYLTKSPNPIEYPPVPAAVFTDPEIASVGLTEEEAKSQKLDYLIGKSKFNVAMAKARGTEFGLVKLIVERSTGCLLGAHIIGEEASTLIQELVLAATLKLTVQQLYQQIYIHPALPEVIRGAVRDALKQIDPEYEILF